jgi:hypothetical protein
MVKKPCQDKRLCASRSAAIGNTEFTANFSEFCSGFEPDPKDGRLFHPFGFYG